MSSSTPARPTPPPTATRSEFDAGDWRPPTELLDVLERSQARGAVGPGDLVEHARHAAGFLAALVRVAADHDAPWSASGRFVDLGSGGGLPGLVLAARLPAARGTLLDGRTERCRLLEAHVAALGWEERIDVVAERAEVAGRRPELRGQFGLAVARSFGPPPVTAEAASPLLAVGGLLVVSEPPDDDPSRWPAAPLAGLGLVPLGAPATVDVGTATARYQVLRQVAPCPERWPRRTGVPLKRPLY